MHSPLASSLALRPLLAASLAFFALSGSARADAAPPRWDIEIDPAAYALRGYSVHLGLNAGHLRYDLGAYAADVPRWARGNEGFDVSMRGFGIKAQYFFDGERHEGWFVGAGFGPTQERLKNRTAGAQLSRTLYGLGAEAGYRFDLGRGFYATPWVGFDYMPRARDVDVSGKVYEDKRVMPFAAVHLGYRF